MSDSDSEASAPRHRSATKPSKKRARTSSAALGESEAPACLLPGLHLKPDHANRPCWISPDLTIFLEAFSPYYRQAYDFLVTIAEPVARPEHIHQYRVTQYSLYAAAAVGIDAGAIVRVLGRLSKTEVPSQMVEFVHESTRRFGKAKLVLRQSKYFVEARQRSTLEDLLDNATIAAARVIDPPSGSTTPAGPAAVVDRDGFLVGRELREDSELAKICNVGRTIEAIQREEDDLAQDMEEEFGAAAGGGGGDGGAGLGGKRARPAEGEPGLGLADFDDGGSGEVLQTWSFQVAEQQTEAVRREAAKMDLPLMEEYDFHADNRNPTLAITLKPATKIREYQEKSLRKMFGNGRARSGIIVLPCGAGKTLTGVTAASTIRKSCVVLCTSAVAVRQWREQFLLWTTVSDNDVVCFTSQHKQAPPLSRERACVLITTYSMMAARKRSDLSTEIVESIKAREWGLMLLDEVHVVPASTFRRVLSVCKAHCKLGLTATLVREDDLISHLNFLIGPKLYEANWIDLTRAGHLANVQCAEVWCEMSPEFFREYLRCTNARVKRLLYAMNPNKFRACEQLKEYHERRGDKVIIFSDDVFALKKYAAALNVPFIFGQTREADRETLLSGFRSSSVSNTIAISKVGDVAIDLPEASVIIQVSSHFGSRRQEAQRLGRILRPKHTSNAEFNAFFYTLVSTDTQEMYFSSKRQRYLIDQGYSFKILTRGQTDATSGTALRTKEAELDLLREVLCAEAELRNAEQAEDAALEQELEQDAAVLRPFFRRSGRAMAALTGDDGERYMEFDGDGW